MNEAFVLGLNSLQILLLHYSMMVGLRSDLQFSADLILDTT